MAPHLGDRKCHTPIVTPGLVPGSTEVEPAYIVAGRLPG